MTKKKLEEPRDIQVQEDMNIVCEYEVSIDSMIDELNSTKERALKNGAIPDSIKVEMVTHYLYHDEWDNNWVVRYTRKETTMEVDKRVKKTLKQRETAKANRAKVETEKKDAERMEYERLKEKYGDT